MNWIVLFAAGIFEIVWAAGMKYSQGFTRPAASIFTIAAMLVSFGLLAWAMRTLPLGTAYAVWTGIGAVGSFIAGIFLFGEAATAGRIASALLVGAGIVGLKLFSPESAS